MRQNRRLFALPVGAPLPLSLHAVSDSARAEQARQRGETPAIQSFRDWSKLEPLCGSYAGVQVAPTHPTAPDWLEAADEVGKRTARPPRQTRVLVVANTKGGVAKTTSVLNIGFALSDLQKQRVLLVDLDGQASLTKSVPREAESGAPKNAPPLPDTLTLADYFRGQAILQSVLRSTRFPNLHLAPAHHDMYRLQFGGAERARAELRFVEDLRMLSPRDVNGQPQPPFDWIVVDTPAGDSFYVRAALAAADYIVFPAYAETFAQLGIEEVLRTAKAIGALMGPVEGWKDRLLGCAITRWKPGANANDNLAKLRLALNNEGILVFQQPIPLDDKVETANRGTVGGGIRNIFRLSPQMGQAAKAYDELVKEMEDHVNRREAKAQRQ